MDKLCPFRKLIMTKVEYNYSNYANARGKPGETIKIEEFKDWERDTIENQQKIVEKYPFLQVRDINGNIDTAAKFPLMYLEIPDGWYNLFYQMCDQIKLILKEKGLLNEFYFIQVKEKYNKLVCYSNMVVDEIEDIIYDYSLIASNSCVICGAPAVYKTTDYIATYCEKCWDEKNEQMFNL